MRHLRRSVLSAVLTLVSACAAFSGSDVDGEATTPVGADAQADGAIDSSAADAGDASEPVPSLEAGTVEWVWHAGGTLGDVVSAVAVDGDGNVLAAGSFSSPELDVGCPDKLVNKGLLDGFVVSLSPAGACRWARAITGAENEEIYGAAAAPDGSVVVVGLTRSAQLVSGGVPLATSAGPANADGFALAFDAKGKPTWGRIFGTAAADEFISSVAIDRSGAVVVGGTAMATSGADLTMAGAAAKAPASPMPVGVVFELGADGVGRWGRAITAQTGSDVYVDTVAVDNSGGIVVVGSGFGTLNAAKPPTISVLANPSGGSRDVFAMRLQRATEGTTSWAWMAGGADGDEAPPSVAVDPGGSFALAAPIREAVSLHGGGVLPTAGDYDVALGWFGPGGDHTRSLSFGGSNGDYPRAVALDEDGSTYIVGSAGGAMKVGDGTLQSFGSGDGFVVAYDSSARVRFAQMVGSDAPDAVTGVAVAPNRRLVIGGYFGGQGRIGSETTLHAGGNDAFVAQLAR